MLNSVQDTLKTIFFGERFAPADAAPRQLLEKIMTIPRLTSLLPYLAWMDKERLFVLEQDTFSKKAPNKKDKKAKKNLGFVIETFPQTGASEEMERILASLFLSCPPGTGIQISLYGSPHILPTLKRQESMLKGSAAEPGSVFHAMSQRRAAYYMKGVGKSLFSHTTYLLRDFRCIIAITMPLDPEIPGDVESILRIRESTHATLRSAQLPGRDWNPDDLLNFVADFFQHDRVFNNFESKRLEYDENKIIRNQLSDTTIASTVADNHMRFRKNGGKETALQCFSVAQYPSYFRLGDMSNLIGDYYQMALSIPAPFLITMGAITVDYETARTKAQMKAARATQASESVMARFQPDLQAKKRDWDMTLRAFDNGRGNIKMYHSLVTMCNAEDASRTEHAIAAVWRARGFDLAKSFYHSHMGLISALPCTLTAGMQKDLEIFGIPGTKTTDNAVMLSPLVAEWKGTRTPMLTLFGRRGQVMTFDLFDNDGGNYNFAVAALSGSGKSVFVNEMAFRYLGAGAKIWIIDVGRSYRNLCDLMDGEFIEFSSEGTNQLCLNPFTTVKDISEEMEMLLPLITQMASPRETLDSYTYTELQKCIKNAWDEKGNKATITTVYEQILKLSRSHGMLHENTVLLDRLAAKLVPYTAHGVYASYFEGDANIEFTKDLVILELEELKSKKDLQAVVMQLMMYRITQEMYLDRSQRKLVIIDEAWDLMGSGSSASFIEAGYRRARKYGGSFGTITQSVEDYYKNEATKAAITNADWLFLLRQKPESIERLAIEGKLFLNEWTKRQLASVTTERPHYSEVFVHSPMGSGVGRLILDPYSMQLYSTTAEDFEAVNNLRKQGMTTAEAMDFLLDRKGVAH
jgi:conjugal transfer ATP-binding protein TraC